MPHNMYRVIFIGDLVEMEKQDVVKRNLANLFGTTAGNMDRLFGTHPIILKKNIDRENAIRFRDAIIRCGAFCRIETMDSSSEILIAMPDDAPGEIMFCPRCNKEQEKSPLCRHCGAIVQEYRIKIADNPDIKVKDDEINRRYYERRQDLETSVNVMELDERRIGRDRRQAHLSWRM